MTMEFSEGALFTSRVDDASGPDLRSAFILSAFIRAICGFQVEGALNPRPRLMHLLPAYPAWINYPHELPVPILLETGVELGPLPDTPRENASERRLSRLACILSAMGWSRGRGREGACCRG
jgi:hypothetical protein